MTTITLSRGSERMLLSPIDRASVRAMSDTLRSAAEAGWVLLGIHHVPARVA